MQGIKVAFFHKLSSGSLQDAMWQSLKGHVKHTFSSGIIFSVILILGHAQVLLLDEITVDLDVLGRADLLQYLIEETEERGATIIYVSLHIQFASTSNY